MAQRVYAPTPISSRSPQRTAKVPARNNRRRNIAIGVTAVGGTIAAGYVAHRSGLLARNAIFRPQSKINNLYGGFLKMRTKVLYREVGGMYKDRIPGMSHRLNQLSRGTRNARRYARYSGRPFTVGFNSARNAGWNRRKATSFGTKNMYNAHKPHIIKALNRMSSANQSYRRVRRDYRGRFKGWM